MPILHNLEQISSDEHIGSLAENLLEALKENGHVAKQVAATSNANSGFLNIFVWLNLILLRLLAFMHLVNFFDSVSPSRVNESLQTRVRFAPKKLGGSALRCEAAHD